MGYIDRNLVPAFQRFVKQGWNLFSQAVVWFHNNSKWFLPFLKNVVLGFGAWVVAIGPIVSGLGVLSEAFGGSITGALAFAGTAFLVVKNWRIARQFFEGLNEWIFGTKALDPKNKGVDALRAFGQGASLGPHDCGFPVS